MPYERRTRRRPLTLKMIERGIRHPGLPCPIAMERRSAVLRDSVSSWSEPARCAMFQSAVDAYFRAYLDRALMCPVRYVPRNPHQRCETCGTLNRYERLVPAWVALRAEGDPDDEREAYCETVNDTATIRCLGCGMDDAMEEIPQPPAALPDWSINLDGSERESFF